MSLILPKLFALEYKVFLEDLKLLSDREVVLYIFKYFNTLPAELAKESFS